MEFVDSANADDDDVQPSGNENIWISCADGDINRVKELLASGIHVDAQDDTGYSPLHSAVSWNQIELVQYLLSVGANIHLRDTDGDTPLLVCETPEMMQLLLASGAKIDDVNSEGEHLFEKVMEDENIIMIQYMIENKHIDDAKAEKAMEFLRNNLDVEDFENSNWEQLQDGDNDDDNEEEVADGNMTN